MSALPRPQRLTGLALGISSAALVLLYLWDHLSRRRQWASVWCREHYGYPSEFGYLMPDRTERINAAITAWSWFPPGAQCTFTDVITKQSVLVAPSVWRGYIAVFLIVLTLVLAGSYLYLRLRRSQP